MQYKTVQYNNTYNTLTTMLYNIIQYNTVKQSKVPHTTLKYKTFLSKEIKICKATSSIQLITSSVINTYAKSTNNCILQNLFLP